jgi:hypothetical protein
MKLWNFRTLQYDPNVTTITDTNAFDYMPQNHVAENHYAMQRQQGEQPIQALTQILSQHQVWD